MRIRKHNKLSLNRSKTSPNGADGDFSSILDESPWERFTDKIKPLIKVLVVLAIIGGAVYGGVLLFGGESSKEPIEYAGSNTTVSQDDDELKLYQCLDDIGKANPSPETSDPDFFKKLIDGYDKRLGCYDKYPDIDLAGKSQMEENRKSAIDSSKQVAPVAGGGTTQSSGETRSSSYDPHKCDAYKNEYERLKVISDQLHETVQKSLDSPGPTSDSLMEEWKAALDKQNKAYSSFQQCQQANYNS